jgi:hypothetical protein
MKCGKGLKTSCLLCKKKFKKTLIKDHWREVHGITKYKEFLETRKTKFIAARIASRPQYTYMYLGQLQHDF